MHYLLKATVQVRLNIIVACCVDIQIKAGHYFYCSLVGSYLAKDIIIIENYQNTTKSIYFCLNDSEN